MCECVDGVYDLMKNECVSTLGKEYYVTKLTEAFSVIFGCLMFLDLYFFGNPVNLLLSFELV